MICYVGIGIFIYDKDASYYDLRPITVFTA